MRRLSAALAVLLSIPLSLLLAATVSAQAVPATPGSVHAAPVARPPGVGSAVPGRATQWAPESSRRTETESVEPVIVVVQSGPTYAVEADVLAEGVGKRTAWGVLTDYDRMSSYMPNLRESRITRADASGERLIVEQKGVARWGMLSRSFQTVREVRLRPYERVVTNLLGGTLNRVVTETRITESPEGTRIRYRIEVDPGMWVPQVVTDAVIRHQVRAQFRALIAEMVRRQATLLGGRDPDASQAITPPPRHTSPS